MRHEYSHQLGERRPITADESESAALEDILRRFDARVEEIAHRLSRTYQDELVEYRSLSHAALEQDVTPLAVDKIRQMLSSLMSDTVPAEKEIRLNVEAAARRFHQAVPLSAVLRAYRLRERTVWSELVDSADLEDPIHLRVLLGLASRVMEHMDIVSSAVAQAYLDEQSGLRRQRLILRRELLEALIDGRFDAKSRVHHIDALALQDIDVEGSRHTVISCRFTDGAVDSLQAQEVTRLALREHLSGPTGSFRAVMGLRENEIVWLVEVRPNDGGVVEAAAQAVESLDGLVVGVGSDGVGLDHIAVSYRQARAAVTIALTAPRAGRVLTHRDVLLDLAIAQGAESAGLLESAVAPLIAYDRAQGTDLVATLEAYLEHRFHAARAATVLHVKPNTVLYRLARIAQVSGHDPMSVDGILVLSLGIKALWHQRRIVTDVGVARLEAADDSSTQSSKD